MTKDPTSLGDILNAKKTIKKPPAYEWQDLALKIINDLRIPNFKRGSVFQVCKKYPKIYVEQCLNDTKELCETGDGWKYFFKVVENRNKTSQCPTENP